MFSSAWVWALLLGLVSPVAPTAGRSKPAGAPQKRQVPRTEARRARPRPYQVGRATWYGDRFHGRLTASGEQFDMFHLTAAHQKLPLGSHVRVTHVRSGRTVLVRINDRGPNSETAVIDLSYAAARELGLVQTGSFTVRIELANPEVECGLRNANCGPWTWNSEP